MAHLPCSPLRRESKHACTRHSTHPNYICMTWEILCFLLLDLLKLWRKRILMHDSWQTESLKRYELQRCSQLRQLLQRVKYRSIPWSLPCCRRSETSWRLSLSAPRARGSHYRRYWCPYSLHHEMRLPGNGRFQLGSLVCSWWMVGDFEESL